LALNCQEPPVEDWWNEYATAYSWFLSMLGNFAQLHNKLAFSHQLKTGGKFPTFRKRQKSMDNSCRFLIVDKFFGFSTMLANL
jgi:hypothetical protein